MRVRKQWAVVGVVAMSAALAGDALQIRPGRWQMTAQIDFPGGKKPPPGMPLAEPMTDIACITAEHLKKWKAPMPPPDEPGCKVSNYRADGKEYSYTVKCDEMAMDFKATVHSPDSFTGISKSHGQDPNQQLTMKFTGKRVGEACSAKELAEQEEEDDE
jgi:hypothetical protein